MVVLAAPALTGCFNGQQATTTTQATMNSGNGVDAQAGAMHVEDATLVLGPEGSSSATLLTRIVNTGPVPDTLVYATINGVQVTVPEGASQIAPGASVPFAYESANFINTYELDVPVSSYVPVVLGFQDAGLVSFSALTVPPAGYYEGIAPEPATAPVPAASPAAG